MRAGARSLAARHAPARGVDATAPIFAVGAPLLGILVLLLAKLILPA